IVQMTGLAFLFVPIATVAYLFIPPEANNQASSLINLARNVGASMGTSAAATFLERWSQVHQGALVSHLTPFNEAYRRQLDQLTQMLLAQGASVDAARARATEMIYDMLQQQSAMLAVTDDFHFLALVFIASLPLVLLLKRYDPRE